MGAGPSLDHVCTVGWTPPSLLAWCPLGWSAQTVAGVTLVGSSSPWGRAASPSLLLALSSAGPGLGHSSFGLVFNSPWPRGHPQRSPQTSSSPQGPFVPRRDSDLGGLSPGEGWFFPFLLLLPTQTVQEGAPCPPRDASAVPLPWPQPCWH